MSAPAREGSLVRAVGTWALAASIVNITVGGGIFRLPSDPGVSGVLGAAAPLAYLVCAVAMGLIVICFAEAGSRVSLTGGPYAYVERAFGPFAGWMSGVLLWVLGTTAVAAVSTVFADNLVRLVPALDSRGAKAALIAGAFAVTAAINIRGVRQGARLNTVVTIAKLAPLLLLVAAGAFALVPENLAWQEAPGAGDVSRASVVLIFAFAGIESALVPSGEVRDPARTVPRAIFIAMTGVTLLYIAVHLVALGVLGPALTGSATPLADAAGVALGPWGSRLLALGVVVSTFGYLGGMTLAIPRALFAFARDGFLPRPLADVHARWHTPYVAIVVQAVLAVMLAVTSGFARLALLSNVAVLLLYLGCCLAAWELRRRDVREGGIPFRVPGAVVAPALAAVVILYLLASVTWREWAVVIGVLVAATALFAATAGRRARLAAEAAEGAAGARPAAREPEAAAERRGTPPDIEAATD
ncbi:MAG TPA: APC family permease [Gemmatimonadaceae bacterium]|nr:APC family permease [Gemmatimonadaceae bacterium]